MPRRAKELSALAVSRLKNQGFFSVGGVAGLYLQVSSTNAKSWIFRTVVGGKRKEIGLGGYPDVGLSDARDKARKIKDEISQGLDPVAEKQLKKNKLIAELAKAITFKEAANQYIAIQSHGWKNTKHASQWENTIETYANPVIGNIQIKDIDEAHILKILNPIWISKNETASRLRGRLEKVLGWAIASKYRSGDNPARWKDNLEFKLAPSSKVKTIEHHPALHYDDIGSFMAKLRLLESLGARALEFTILTAARSGEVRGATWSEFNLDKKLWIIPAERMKAGKEHYIPLSQRTVDILKAMPVMSDNPYAFSGTKGKLSDMTLTAVLKRMGRKNITVHGFRSTFRDWAGEKTNFPREVCEHALAHRLKDKAEAAYQRGSLFDKRIGLMNEWAKYCDIVHIKANNVININEMAAT